MTAHHSPKARHPVSRDIHVLVTMDCEVPVTHAGATGPKDYAESARFIEAYASIAGEHGYPVTLLTHPETALAHPAVFDRLRSEGAVVGLHIHPWKFSDGRYKANFGGLSEADQRSILSEAIALWKHALGDRPLYFRPGTYSANDSTFRILDDLGFLGGSVSAPERSYPTMQAVWVGAPRDPHRADANFRLSRGALDFVNIPLSGDYETFVERKGRRIPRDLRPDWPPDQDYSSIVDAILEQTLDRDPIVPCIQIVAHNDADYADETDRITRNFRETLSLIESAARRRGCRAVAATFASVRDAVVASAAQADLRDLV